MGEFIELARSAEKYALKPPGEGGILDFMIVRTKWSVPMNRLYGGSAARCGYWWNMPFYETVSPAETLTTQRLAKASGVCPEWNTDREVVSCQVKKGWAFIVGQGQSTQCSDGEVLHPPAGML